MFSVLKLRSLTVAPARERGLKYKRAMEIEEEANGRSREGAWIEISLLLILCIIQ